MSYLSENNKQYYRYFGLLAVVILGVVSILGSGGGGGGDSTPPPPTGPSIDNVFPSSNSDTALVTTVVTAQFDRAMDKTTIDDPEKNFTVIDDLTKNDVPGSVEYFSTYEKVHDYVAVFTPNKDLDTGNSYTATITTDVKDTSGDPLARNYVWSFFIASSPMAVSVNETDEFGTTGVDSASPSAPSATGEYVVFASMDNLANLNTGGVSQIYRKNTVTKKVELVSTTSDNLTLADGPCASPRISDTGRYVVFTSTASNLAPTVTNTAGKSHVYFKDMREGTIRLLDKSITNPGWAGNGDSRMPDISGIPDTGSGKYVVFESTAVDLHADDTDDTSDIFLINVTSGTVELVSKSSDVNPDPDITEYLKGNDNSYRPRVSDNGSRVIFDSIATNLLDVGGDTNGKSDIFLRNLGNDTTIRLSVDEIGNQVNGGTVGSINADISADGAYAVFQSDQPTLSDNVNNGIIDIFVRQTGENDYDTIKVLSLADGDDGANGNSERPSISADGRYITFESKASDLVAGDTNGVADIFVRERNSTTISLLSIDNNDNQGDLDSINAAISANGRYVSFTSDYNFDTSDGNGGTDIYRAYNAEFR